MKKKFKTPLMNISVFDKESVVAESAVYSTAADEISRQYSLKPDGEHEQVLRMIW